MKEKLAEKYKESVSDGKGTLFIIFINIVLFLALNTIPRLREILLLNPEIDVIIERPWTLVTALFSHEFHIHIIFNMVLFFFFGLELEKITDTKTVVMVYLISGLMGSLTIPFFAPIIQWTEPILGASAAVFGVVTVFSVLRPNIIIFGSKAKLWAWALFILNIPIALFNPQLSVGAAAHAMGSLVGLISGYWLKNK